MAAGLGCATSNYTPFLTAVAPTANPLVAQYTVRHYHSGYTVWVEFGTDTNYGRKTSVMSDSANAAGGAAVNVLVAGMLPQTTYHMRAHVDSSTGSWVDDDHTFTTGALPSSPAPPKFAVSTGTVNSNTVTGPAPGIELLSLVSTSTPPGLNAVATDLHVRLIWFCPLPAMPPKLLPNGHFLFQLGSDLQEVDLACNTIRDVSLGQLHQSLQAKGYSFPPFVTFHHDMLVLPNGHWIALAQMTKDFTDLPGYPGTTTVQGDVLMDIDLDGNVVWVWSAFDHLDVNRHLFGLPDWTHSNALVYTADGNLLLSMRGQSWIIKIDYEDGAGSGNILWRLGQEGDFTLLAGDPTQWFYGQHYPYIMNVSGSQTTMAVYDDGNYRVDSSGVQCGSTPTAPACYSRAAIFKLDESTRLASLLWQDLPGYYSFWGGSITPLSNGDVEDVEYNNSDPFNTLSSQILEVTQTDTHQVVWQLDITGAWAYRGTRIPSLYPGVVWQH